MSTAFTRYLRLDSPFLRGTDVQALQARIGVPVGQCDGVFGPSTQQAVIAFQKTNRLVADGVVGPKTWSVIFGQSADEQAVAAKKTKSFGEVLAGYVTDGLGQFHSRYPDSVKWRLTADGLEIESSGIEKSEGKPETVRRICEDYKGGLEKASLLTGVPIELLIATMCTESFDGKMHAVNPRAERKEPSYISDAATPHRVSYGLMQTLISTARHAVSQLALESAISEDKIDRDWLFVPGNSILAGAAYIAAQSQRTLFDPPLVACAYNAGSIIYNNGSRNRWKMRQYPLGSDAHANRFVQWFNDCFRYFKESGYPFGAGTSFWQQLTNPAFKIAPAAGEQRKTVTEYIFPLRKRPVQDYKSGAREFGAARSGGKRKHAGCDLKAPKGTEILCMANGTVIRGPYPFYEGTYALEVQHENGVIVRYGEISEKVPQGIGVGAKVTQGQVIALVGQLNSGNSMLHLEMYDGSKTGPLTQPGTAFKRRADLLDPTPYLDRAILLEDAGNTVAASPPAVLEDRSQTAESRELSDWEKVLMTAPTTGASKKTAQQDHLEPGIKASQAMAAADLPRAKQLAERFHSAAVKFGLPSALLAAIASRESRCGAVLKEGWGDHNQAFGIMQVDKRHHEMQGLPDPQSLAHVEQAAGIICANLERVAEIHQNWEAPFILKGAVVAYNSGIDNVRTKDKMDEGTTGDDYGSDVIARAQYYLQHEELPIFRQ